MKINLQVERRKLEGEFFSNRMGKKNETLLDLKLCHAATSRRKVLEINFPKNG